jgi:hypothetical protein
VGLVKHVEHKIFTIFEFEEEEKWLNEKSAKGEHLTDVGFCRYVFKDGKPGEYIYRLEMLDKSPSHYSSVKYLQFLEETGVEHIASILKWVYLRKKASDGPFDIYSDIDSKIKHYERIINFANILIIIQLLCVIPIMIFAFTGHYTNNTYLFNLIIAIILFVANRSLKNKVDKLKKEKIYRE